MHCAAFEPSLGLRATLLVGCFAKMEPDEKDLDMTGNSKLDAKLCIAVARVLSEQRNGGPLEIVDFPDVSERKKKAIDLIVRDAVGLMAFEHTLIESFGGQIASGIAARRLAALLESRVGGLPEGRFHLVVDPTKLPPSKSGEAFADAIAAGVLAAAGALAIGEPGMQRKHFVEIPTEVARPATLYRWPGPRIGSFELRFTPPKDLEILRQERALKAVSDKTPKLLMAAGKDALSVLVLEDRDVALSNHPLVAAALKEAAGNAPSANVMFLVEMSDGVAEGCLLKDMESWFPEVMGDWCRLDTAVI